MSYLVTPFSRYNRFFDRRLRSNLDQYFDSAVDSWTPSVDVAENKNAYAISVDLPGVNADDISISLEKGVLTLEGSRTIETSAEDIVPTRRERFSGSFKRQFSLPESADVNSIDAKSENGVLYITIGKIEDVQPVTIQVRAA